MLKIEGLSVSYGRRRALKGVSLGVDSGEVVALIGPNGSGKSTLIRAASGVLPVDAGDVRVDGRSLAELSTMERARYLAVVPQARNLPPAFSVYESILLGRTPYLGWLGRAGDTDHERVRYALERTQMQPLADRLVGELSGGEQQRVLLARALAQDAPVLLLDEPTTHLDLQHRETLIHLVRELASSRRLAVLMVLHDLNLASLYADRLSLLVDGELRATGTPEEVLTEETLSMVYHVPVHVIPHPEYGTPLILPDGRGNEPNMVNTKADRK
ncbi:MAG TPA: heme ABC transporter ATP-binding protein [Anaerolineales bacterium]|nr:heme ABC transporter ATP-binding protein [Anaerolineales bacterium]